MGIELGELRTKLKDDLGQTLDKLLIQYEDRFDLYYITVYSFWDVDLDNTLRTRIYISEKLGRPMLGTMCFAVDNKLCSIKQLWIKPMDGPQWDKEELLSDEGVDKVGQQAVDTGTILHSGMMN